MRRPRRKELGVTVEEYERMLSAQGGHCALCPARPKTRQLNVDHDHETGEVRGLLCHRCNRALPSWVTAAWLFEAAEYIDPHSVAKVDATQVPAISAIFEEWAL